MKTKNYAILAQYKNGNYSVFWQRDNATLADVEKALEVCNRNWKRTGNPPIVFICSPKRAHRLTHPR